MEPLQGKFIELGRVKGFDNNDNNNCKDTEGIVGKACDKSGKSNAEEAEEQEVGGGGDVRLERELPTPKEICKGLDEFVIGQDKAKKV